MTVLEKVKAVNHTNNGPVYALTGLTAVLVGAVSAVLILSESSGDIDKLISFVATVVPLVLGYAFLNGKVNRVGETADSIHENVNGKLDAKFDNLHKRLDSLGAKPVERDDEIGEAEADAAASA